MKSIIIIFLVLSFSLLQSPSFASGSYTITVEQIDSLSQNLTALKELIVNLRQKLETYKQDLLVTEKDLQVSQLKLEKAENESNTFILKLTDHQRKLKEQSELLNNAKTSLKRLRRKDKAKNVLFGIIIAVLAWNR